jgi:hypothetical protein
MVAHVAAPINWLRAILRRTPVCPPDPTPPPLPDDPCPLVHPDAPLPSWVTADPVVQKYRCPLLPSLAGFVLSLLIWPCGFMMIVPCGH